MSTWLSLTDYASKYRVSISTLRRRIKAGQLSHRLDNGRYMLFDEPSSEDAFAAQMEMPAAAGSAAPMTSSAQTSPIASSFAPSMASNAMSAQSAASSENEEPILSSASRLLNELKRAYTSVLQEREEQIIQLKEEVSDLKTLVRVLEDDNDRMRRVLSGAGRA